MVKVVWGEPDDSPEAGIRFVEPGSIARGRPVYAPAPVGRPPIDERHPLLLGIVAVCLVLPVLVGAAVGWLLG